MKPTLVTNSIRALLFARAEMTQAELAHRVGVTRQTVIAIEQGRYSPSLEMAFHAAGFCGRYRASTTFAHGHDRAPTCPDELGRGH